MWQQTALERHLDAHRADPGFADRTVFLADPARERALDARLLRAMWPGVLDALAATRWTATPDSAPGAAVRGAIRTRRRAEIDRALAFLVEDPDRPRGPGSGPPWFCRGTLSCTAGGYFVAFDFVLSLPIDFPFPEILRALSEPRLAGCAPELRFDPGVSGVAAPTLDLGLTWGRGAAPWEDGAAFAAVRDATAANAAAIDAVRDLERDYGDASAYERVFERLTAAYEAF